MGKMELLTACSLQCRGPTGDSVNDVGALLKVYANGNMEVFAHAIIEGIIVKQVDADVL